MSEIKLTNTVERPSEAQRARARSLTIMTEALFFYLSMTRIHYAMIEGIYDGCLNTEPPYEMTTEDYLEGENIETLGCIILCSRIAIFHYYNRQLDISEWYDDLLMVAELDEPEYELDGSNEPHEFVEMVESIASKSDEETSGFDMFEATCKAVLRRIKNPKVWSAIEHLTDRLEANGWLSGEEIEEYLYDKFGEPIFCDV